MPIPQSKHDLSFALNQAFQKLLDELKTVPPALTKQKTLEGSLSACDLLAYQIGWGQLLIGWYQSGKRRIMPSLPAKGFKWNELGALSKHFYETFETYSFEQLLAQFERTVQEIQEIINENSDEQLYTIGVYEWTGSKWPLGRWINVNSSSPYKNARVKIRKWKKAHKI